MYEGQSIGLLNSLITGQDSHSLNHYLSAYIGWIDASLLAIVGLVIALNTIGLIFRLDLHKRSVTGFNVIVFTLLCVLVIAREPMLMLQPRFWAEEATVYFYTAISAPFWEAVIAPHQGYYSFLANVAALLAKLPKLEYAPAVTTGISLLVQLAVLAAVMINNSAFLDTSLKKALAGIATVIVGAVGEIWLTTICSQHYLVLLMFLILIDEKHSPVKRRSYYVIAGVTAISSVASCFLTPLFLLRYLVRRQKQDFVLFAILSAACLIQLFAILYSHLELGDAAYFHSSQARFSPSTDWLLVLNRIIFYAMEYPLSGFSRNWFSVAAAIMLSALTVYALTRKPETYWAPVAAIWVLTIISVLASLNMAGGERYAYASAVIVSIFLIGLTADKDHNRLLRLVAGLLLVRSLAFWSLHYDKGMVDHYDPDWPVWADEVAAWREDPTKELRAHPQLEAQRKRGIEWSARIDDSWIE